MKTIIKMMIIVFLTMILVKCSKDEEALNTNPGILKSTNPSGGKIVYNRKVYPLTAGRNINAGNVSIAVDSFNLYVIVKSFQGFQNDSANIKGWFGTDLAFLNGGGTRRPALGKLPFKLTTLTDSAVFKVALSSVPNYDQTRGGNQSIYFVIGADVLLSKSKCGISHETAFAGTIRGKGRAPWYYDVYIDSCCTAPIPIIY
jgi:hypothetical protein